MTRHTRAPATRSNLLRDARRLDQVNRGTLLLKRKRQALVDELFTRARTAVTSREAIDARRVAHGARCGSRFTPRAATA